MPQVPRYETSTVSPNTGDLPLQQANANPEAFGAGLAQAVQQFGGTLGEVGAELHRNALMIQEQDNQVTKESMINDYMGKKTDMLFAGDQAFYNLRGKAAYDAYAPARDGLASMREDMANNAPNKRVRQLFDNDTRRDVMLTEQNMGQHADRERKAWYAETDQASVESAIAGAGTARTDADFSAANDRLQAAVVSKGMHNGWDTDTVQNEYAKERSRLYSTRALMMSASSATAAVDWTRANADKFYGEDYPKLVTRLMEVARPEMADAAAEHAVNNGSVPAVGPEEFVQKYIIPVGEHGKNGQRSPEGALGVGQVTPATAAFITATDPQLKAAGITFDPHSAADQAKLQNDPKYNQAIAEANMRYLYSRYQGDPVVSAVGYVAGPGNADKLLQNGDPRQIGYQAWIDKIPSSMPQTKAYAQRILDAMGNPTVASKETALSQIPQVDANIRAQGLDARTESLAITRAHQRLQEQAMSASAENQEAQLQVIGTLTPPGQPPVPLSTAMTDVRFTAAWAKLDERQQAVFARTSEAAVQRDLNTMTAEKMQRYQQLVFQSTTDPGGFAKTDFVHEDLPTALKEQLIRKAASINKHQNPGGDPNVHRVLADPRIKTALMQVGILDEKGKVADAASYNQFGGQLIDLMEQSESLGKKMNTEEAVKAANAFFIRQPAYHQTFLGMDVPGTHHDATIQYNPSKVNSAVAGVPLQEYQQVKAAMEQRFPGQNVTPAMVYNTWKQAQK